MALLVVSEILTVTPEWAESLAALIRQLSTSAKVPTHDEWRQIFKQPDTLVLVARRSGSITPFLGMLTLVLFRIPTGVRGIIEDVVVDEAHRRQGIAEELTREALARAEAAGARTVDLTSRPSREAANRLYQRLGFQQRESNVYRFSFTA